MPMISNMTMIKFQYLLISEHHSVKVSLANQKFSHNNVLFHLKLSIVGLKAAQIEELSSIFSYCLQSRA